jgi:hypothetical protein
MSLRINSDFNGVTDPDAGAYIAAVEAADGQLLEFAVGKAINDFVVGCKQDRIWDAIKASCILAGARTLSGALVPLAGTAPTNFNFVSGDYNRKTGLAGNGSTKYLNSNRNNNADPQNSKHLATYCTSVPSSTAYIISAGGFADNGNSGIYRNGNSYDARVNVTASDAANGIVTNVLTTPAFLGVVRTASNVQKARVGTLEVSNSALSVSPFNGNIGVFVSLPFTLPSNPRLAFYSIGESLDLALLDARVTALITAFGVAIP